MTAHAIKLWGGMVIFVAVGLVGAHASFSSPLLLPEGLFYVLLLVHTYLSIDLFSRIETRTFDQVAIDVLLCASYIGLGLSMGTSLTFFFANVCLFVAAPLKYAFLLEKIPYAALLRRKILVDLSGTVLAVGTLGIALMGYPVFAAWTQAVLFGLASVRYLITHPLYRV